MNLKEFAESKGVDEQAVLDDKKLYTEFAKLTEREREEAMTKRSLIKQADKEIQKALYEC